MLTPPLQTAPTETDYATIATNINQVKDATEETYTASSVAAAFNGETQADKNKRLRILVLILLYLLLMLE